MVAARHVLAARILARQLIKILAMNKTYNDFKSRGIGVGKDILYSLQETVDIDAGKVSIIPAWRWLLSW